MTRAFGEILKQEANGVFGIGAWGWDFPYPGMKEMNEQFTKRFNQTFIPQEANTDDDGVSDNWEEKDIANLLQDLKHFEKK